MPSPLISPQDSLALWAVLFFTAGGSILLEGRFSWAKKLSGPILALFATMLLSAFGVIPSASPVYDQVWDFVVPFAIPLLLFSCNLARIGRETGRMLLLFCLSALGTLLGGVVGGLLLAKHLPQLSAVSAMFTATYIGGSVNCAAMAQAFGQAGTPLAAAVVVADNLLMALYFFLLLLLPALRPLAKKFPPLSQSSRPRPQKGEGRFSLSGLAFALCAAMGIVWASSLLSDFLAGVLPSSSAPLALLHALLSNRYLIITALTLLLATLFPSRFGSTGCAGEIGTFCIYLFFAVIGAPASLSTVMSVSPMLFVYAAVIVLTNLAVTLLFGRLLRFSLEEVIVAANANTGGPTTAAALAASQGWDSLVGPAMLTGTLGYAIGSYLGILVGNLFLSV
ncbi:MAG: DUF819 family protein [Oscillospiraceae bacterium]|jgi:uncharacterized membrane protein|nr:DUF819 family protein [Oscillospiraceae bacterium]